MQAGETRPFCAALRTAGERALQNVRSIFYAGVVVGWYTKADPSGADAPAPLEQGSLWTGREKSKALQRGGISVAKRAFCKNTVKGKQRGQKYPPKLRAEVVMAMLSSSSICAVARKYGIPESTIRSWMAEEARRGDVWAEERRAAAREIALRASLGTRAQVTYLQGRVEENQRAAEVKKRLHAKLDEDARARSFAVGTLLKSEAEELNDAAQTGLVVYSSPGSYDRQLDEGERRELLAQMKRYDSRTMTDKNAAAVANVLMTVAQRAAEMLPPDSTQSEAGKGAPLIQIETEETADGEAEVVVLEKTEG